MSNRQTSSYSYSETTTSSYDSTSPDHKVHAHTVVDERVVPQSGNPKQSHIDQSYDVDPQTGRVENVRDAQQEGDRRVEGGKEGYVGF
ncbi:hypothetical protein HK097_003548 [Rhizophlyctis rosea]|uniref:Uncharacterized protein n=1 Tax=Rhizophlyctis rosea TaxID=64517 RepID=A0AAD5S3A6_9FUNG|nr:hypothetical protein HK097_003548 [Rhizophlyctis rosea]